MNCPPLISKYKPYFVNDFYADPSFKCVLHTLFELDDINVLFIGNSNTGKTTLLYAIIREYYGLSKESSFPENNILHINNLKEQGINYFRNEMKTFCRSSSNIYGKKKLVIIDDLDMINEQSQQVFRNYIDKYKNNVNFISVCSNIQKVIESIQSRVHILKLQVPDENHILQIMNHIIQNENMVIDDVSRAYLLKISNGSIRTLMNHLEKVYIYNEAIDLEICKKLCVNMSSDKFVEYFQLLRNNQIPDAIHVLYSIHDYGYSVIDILDYFFTFVKEYEQLSEDEKYRLIPVICKYITIFHNVHEDGIELALFTKGIREQLFCNQ